MLPRTHESRLTEFDEAVFQVFVPQDHYLRRVADCIDFERFRATLEEGYCPTMGRPPIDVVRMFQFMFLRFHYKLSDRQVMVRTQTDMAFRWFLSLGQSENIPDHTNGTHFRQRVGAERFDGLFQELVSQAREHGLVSDRLRLKDATHVFADAAEVQPLRLAAQVRDRLLREAKPFFPEWVAEQSLKMEALRQATAELADQERLARRLEFLLEMTVQLRERVAALPNRDHADVPYHRLERILAVAAKLLDDHADPKAGDRLASGVDSEARVGKHGDYYTGFMLDMAIDADSEIITAINLLPANGQEAADAVVLIRKEEEAQGNDVAGLSMDGIGYNGPVLRELGAPDGLNLEVIVPPPRVPERRTYGPERFALTVLEDGKGELTCPAGQKTRQRERTADEMGSKYTFKASQCSRCNQREDCLQNPASKKGRKVIKNDYEGEYRKLQAKVGTEEYQKTRGEHSKIERKLGEMARHHGMRQAQFRGEEKVRSQALLTGMVVNIKRMVYLFSRKVLDVVSPLTVRAEPCKT